MENFSNDLLFAIPLFILALGLIFGPFVFIFFISPIKTIEKWLSYLLGISFCIMFHWFGLLLYFVLTRCSNEK